MNLTNAIEQDRTLLAGFAAQLHECWPRQFLGSQQPPQINEFRPIRSLAAIIGDAHVMDQLRGQQHGKRTDTAEKI
jgi:hypothetical protein